jgi:flavin reductase (DIM6/NTAB) family NADH-FMN oxidoreductase RutF
MHAYQRRTLDPLFWYPRRIVEQHEWGWHSQHRAHVLSLVVRLELHARSRGKGTYCTKPAERKECVLNLPSVSMVAAVNKLARLTGSSPVPPHKLAMGYRHEKDKLGVSGLTATPSELVRPPRIHECPVQLEAILEATHPFGTRPDKPTTALAFEMRVVRAHIDESILVSGVENRVDPDKWRPLLMSFCQFYGLGERTDHSTLGEIPEEAYRPVPHMSR